MKMILRHIVPLILLLFGMYIPSLSQPTLKLQYSYLHAPEFDKIFQTYNTSRPWQKDQLYPLTHGYAGILGWNWRVQKAHEIHLLPQLGYTRFATQVSPEGQSLVAGMHLISLGVQIRMHPKAIFKQVQNAGPLGTRFYMSLGIEYNYLRPFVRRNKKTIPWSEDEKYSTYSTQFSTSLGAGYHLFSFGQFLFTPEISVSWFPEIELNQFAEAVNGHNTTGLLNKNDNVIMLHGGLRITFVRKNKNWWDRPRTGDKT